jgi:hypothetical protein
MQFRYKPDTQNMETSTKRQTQCFWEGQCVICKFRPEVMDICPALKLSYTKHKSVSLYAYRLLGVRVLESLSQIYEWYNQIDSNTKDASALRPICSPISEGINRLLLIIFWRSGIRLLHHSQNVSFSLDWTAVGEPWHLKHLQATAFRDTKLTWIS